MSNQESLLLTEGKFAIVEFEEISDKLVYFKNKKELNFNLGLYKSFFIGQTLIASLLVKGAPLDIQGGGGGI